MYGIVKEGKAYHIIAQMAYHLCQSEFARMLNKQRSFTPIFFLLVVNIIQLIMTIISF